MNRIIFFILCCLFFFTACKVQKSGSSNLEFYQTFLNKPEFVPAHIGISIYEPKTNHFLFDHQSEKYFIPASNTKIFTCYAAMKNLGDSTVGFEYISDTNQISVRFTGDPSFLHPDFNSQKSVQFLQQNAAKITVLAPRWNTTPMGNGWAWDDYDFMPERSPMPIYGNMVWFHKKGNGVQIIPKAFRDSLEIFSSMQNGFFDITRDRDNNHFQVVKSSRPFRETYLPFVVKKELDILSLPLLEDTLNRVLHYANELFVEPAAWIPFYTQSTDSLLSIMMHRSDNFFAEQLLLMAANQKIGSMDDEKVIDSLLKSDFIGLPNKPRWVDGSGLSRYNLMTPRNFIWVLNQLKKEFSWDRIKAIFPTANEGSLAGLYQGYEGKIFAKTGSLSNHIALSGYITTNSGKELIFSILVNAHQSSYINIRKNIESLITSIIDQY